MSTPWNPAYKRKSKTYTSSEVKSRYNANHYDVITFRAAKGSLQVVKDLAAADGLSLAAYLKHLIIQDAKNRGKGDISALFGGGGTSST